MRMDFNPRSRKGSDECVRVILSTSAIFQSTLPQGERRETWQCWRAHRYISIHAPARGATLRPDPAWTLQPISIHAPARGATCWIFNASPRETISIHAPARGATRAFTSSSVYVFYFNPRSRKGSDAGRLVVVRVIVYFNPRSRKGSDVSPG